MKSAIFLSARDKSTRLAKKHFLEIQGKTTIQHLIDRLKTAETPDMVVMCTSDHPDDESLVKVAKENNINFFQGSQEDKLDRYLKAAEKFGVDFVAVVDADDIFCDPAHIDKTLEVLKETGADYVICKDLPLGASPFGLSKKALEKVCDVKDEKNTEVWGGYFTNNNLFNVKYIEPEQELKHPEYRMTLDYQEDLDFFKAIFAELYVEGKVFSLKEIVDLLSKKPSILKINSQAQALYEKHLKKSTFVKIKDI